MIQNDVLNFLKLELVTSMMKITFDYTHNEVYKYSMCPLPAAQVTSRR